MYRPGRIGYVGRGSRMGPHPGGHGRHGPPALPIVGLVVGGLFLFSVAGAIDFFPFFFPFFFLFWMIPFFLVPALGLSVRSVAGLFVGRPPGAAGEGGGGEERIVGLAPR